jgi:hypothetical protein
MNVVLLYGEANKAINERMNYGRKLTVAHLVDWPPKSNIIPTINPHECCHLRFYVAPTATVACACKPPSTSLDVDGGGH